MATKPTQTSATKQAAESGQLKRQVQVSESGQFSVSIDAVRELSSFRRDVNNVARIREKLHAKR